MFDIEMEAIYFQESKQWLKHRLNLVEVEGECFLNFLGDPSATDVKVGVGFLADHFFRFSPNADDNTGLSI
eukprot:CAMPEP_0168620816 /NCGR_PEP_ID=MMETSP0449_2-20121227/7351_1 /TAXON_ID=1082188 /ORGANISM="Strombidium rassoulzadegani, Strain ras09" /LENGTH=70 /DNA_ID=CAMNT_0008661871 /DNA_START=1030 /DNA_END=1242 /DNA_ORIENTATION=-